MIALLVILSLGAIGLAVLAIRGWKLADTRAKTAELSQSELKTALDVARNLLASKSHPTSVGGPIPKDLVPINAHPLPNDIGRIASPPSPMVATVDDKLRIIHDIPPIVRRGDVFDEAEHESMKLDDFELADCKLSDNTCVKLTPLIFRIAFTNGSKRPVTELKLCIRYIYIADSDRVADIACNIPAGGRQLFEIRIPQYPVVNFNVMNVQIEEAYSDQKQTPR